MPSNDKADELRLGFLTAVEVADRGYVGGLLVTNRFGRPLEFQCTSPVQPNRMQEILYGPTLLPYVLTELIGTTLLEKVGIKPHIVLTEQEALLELRGHVSIPVALVQNEGSPIETADPEPQRIEKAQVSAESAVAEAKSATEGAAADSVEGVPQETAPECDAGDAVPERAGVREMRLGRQILRFHQSHAGDVERVAAGTTSVPAEADLREPFARVREALEETARAGTGR